jgi:hypothetical protein
MWKAWRGVSEAVPKQSEEDDGFHYLMAGDVMPALIPSFRPYFSGPTGGGGGGVGAGGIGGSPEALRSPRRRSSSV